MSDYTPTTEEVCEIYWQSGYKTTVEQFDRWLASVKADAWEEGANAGYTDSEHSKYTPNPYREEVAE